MCFLWKELSLCAINDSKTGAAAVHVNQIIIEGKTPLKISHTFLLLILNNPVS